MVGALTARIRHLRKRYVIGVIVTGAMIISLAAALAYVQYQNSPQKIVLDAVQNALMSPTLSFRGNVTGATNDTSLASIDGQLTQTKSRLSFTSSSADKLKGEMITDRDDTFLKINRASELVVAAVPSRQADLYASILPQVKETIDDRWIWIEQPDTALVGSLLKLSGCSIDMVQSITRSASSRTSLLNLYRSHPFLIVSKSEGGKGSIGNYTLTIDDVLFDEFMTAFPLSQLATKLSGCHYQSVGITSSMVKGFTIKLTIDTSTRRILDSNVYTGRASQLQLSMKPDFVTTATIDNPEHITRFSDIKQQVFKDFLSRSSDASSQ